MAKPGLIPVPNSDDAAVARRGIEAGGRLVPEPSARDERGGRRDVDAGTEDPAHLVDVGPERVVADAVGLHGQEGVDVVGRDDAEGLDPDEIAHVAADLVGAPGEAADQVEAGVAGDRACGASTDVAGGPLHDPDRFLRHRAVAPWLSYSRPSRSAKA